MFDKHGKSQNRIGGPGDKCQSAKTKSTGDQSRDGPEEHAVTDFNDHSPPPRRQTQSWTWIGRISDFLRHARPVSANDQEKATAPLRHRGKMNRTADVFHGHFFGISTARGYV